ncbi:diguanylate cyclase domain-containing protein [Plasticicumulans acidivorans]|uniref:PAS domain S-box-containing protein/diguanylate cyclase (GGDEF)-like protein n=1 Tax=Plasticicumulans acidivorans TaxID=886464 RepID=A0A317N595_9GAMM|nr:diguanylate cyclase [Plasticicumulans acidivorans]PWV65919.1 PAS domain S-box-containing protein/diguanylate cyclase (GGDEF)-like protein [Plasticicumulans acidivorans]
MSALQRPPLRHLAWLIALVSLLTVGFYWQGLLQQLHEYERGRVERITERAELRALAAYENLHATLLQLDRVLENARAAWRGDRPHLDTIANAALAALPEGLALQLFVIGSDGHLAWSSLGAAPANWLGDRDYFRALAVRPDDRLVFSEPVVGRLSRRRSLLLARPLLEDGRFAGVIAIAIAPDRWARDIAKFSDTDADMVALIRSDGIILLRVPGTESSYGLRVPADRPYLHAPQPPNQILRTISHVDGIERAYAWQMMPEGPVVVAGIGVAAASAEIQALQRDLLLRSGAWTLLLMLTIGGVLHFMHRAERSSRLLADAEDRQRTILATMAEGVMILSPERRIMFANASARSTLHLPEQLDGLRHPDDTIRHALIRPDGQPLAFEHYPTLRCSTHGEDADNVLLGLSDEQTGLRWITVSVRAMRRDSAPPYWIVTSFRDITELREAEAQARMSQSVFDAAVEGILVTDAEHHIIAVNPAFINLTGYAREALLGRTPQFLCEQLPQSISFDGLSTYLIHHDFWEGEILTQRREDGFCLLRVRISVLRDDEGRAWRHVVLFHDITERKHREDQAWRQANYDALTGLPNRTLLLDRLGRALRHAQRSGQQLVALFIDLDRFKPVNDELGHAAGDTLLQQVARRLEAAVRLEDTVARLSGDEFVVIMLVHADTQAAERVADKIVATLTQPFRIDGQSVEISCSVGIAIQQADDDDAEVLLERADAAMYRAKRAGRSTYRY